MSTELRDALRDTFEWISDEPAPTDLAVQAFARAGHRRRVRNLTVGVAAALAVALALTTGSVLVRGAGRSDDPPGPAGSGTPGPHTTTSGGRSPGAAPLPRASTAREPLTLVTVTGNDLSGYRLGTSTATPLAQVVPVSGDARGAPWGELLLYTAGGFDPARVLHGRQVPGGDGYLAELPGQQLPGWVGSGGTGGPAGTALAWRYAGDAWAVLWHRSTGAGGDHGTAGVSDREATDLVGLGSALRFGAVVPLRAPYRVGYLPAGTRPVGGSLETEIPAGGARSQARFADGGAGGGGPGFTIDVSDPAVFDIAPDTTVGGHPAQVTGPGGLWVDFGSCHVFLSAKTDEDVARYPMTELRLIAASLTGLEAWPGLGTWYELRSQASPR